MNWLLKLIIILLFGLVSIWAYCFIKINIAKEPAKATKVVLTPVRIVAVQEHDSAWGWGDSGATTIEYTNGLRRRVCGVLGKVGETSQVTEKISQ